MTWDQIVVTLFLFAVTVLAYVLVEKFRISKNSERKPYGGVKEFHKYSVDGVDKELLEAIRAEIEHLETGQAIKVPYPLSIWIKDSIEYQEDAHAYAMRIYRDSMVRKKEMYDFIKQTFPETQGRKLSVYRKGKDGDQVYLVVGEKIEKWHDHVDKERL